MGVTPCSPKDHVKLVEGWDRLAQERHRQISSGIDLSFDNVIVPTTLGLLGDCDRSVILDVGSGTGEFTARLAEVAGRVIAVEPSRASTAVARNVCQDVQNVYFFEVALEDGVDELEKFGVTAVVAVMSLMTTPDLRKFARAVAELVPRRGRFVAVLTHPCFWPQYWGYSEAVWFRYDREIFLEAPFVISNCPTDIVTTHIHRPLEFYAMTFAQEGFQLEKLVEPVPSAEVQELYPKRWAYPRFIGLRWVKQG